MRSSADGSDCAAIANELKPKGVGAHHTEEGRSAVVNSTHFLLTARVER